MKDIDAGSKNKRAGRPSERKTSMKSPVELTNPMPFTRTSIQSTNRTHPGGSMLSSSRSRHAVRLLLVAGFSLIAIAVSSTGWADCQEGCDLTDDNTFLGDATLINNTTGQNNKAIGSEALYSNTTG